jgi:glucuronate isomerase
LATTESPIDTLAQHRKIRESGWNGRVVTTYRPDAVVDPEYEQFPDALQKFGELTGQDVHSWRGYLEAHRRRRATFADMGATATDHGHPTARTADLSEAECESLFARVVAGKATPEDAELFRAQVLFEMARMSLDDGLVMQIHPGSFRNHNRWLFENYGRDKGADIPMRTEYVSALKPLLDRFGNDPRLSIILFTLDETTYSRELAPLAGHYPVLKLGPAWWFHDSPEGMLRFREQTTETAGFYNTVGFNDDTRAFLSIPARHDVARRVDCSFLARLVVEHRLDEDEARIVAEDLAYRLPKAAYRL